MREFAQLLIAGLSTGAIYASLALALVLIYQSTEVVNFAQGEMAMFSTFIAWELVDKGMPFWAAFALTLAVAFFGGVTIERVLIRPVEKASVLTIVIVTVGLLLIFNNLAGGIWGFQLKTFPSPFPSGIWQISGVVISQQSVGVFGVALLVMALLAVFFRFTALGLAMRATAMNREPAELMGIHTTWMLALGWGLAAVVGATAGVLVAPIVFLDPNMMQGLLLFAFAGATLGGFESPGGAVLGGLLVGVAQAMIGNYVSFIGTDLSLTVAMAIIVLVLVFKPTGLFGHAAARRV
ncbi:MAG: branched-chain amino acid ABC transporter permease [Dehalococcoidia bacterium]